MATSKQGWIVSKIYPKSSFGENIPGIPTGRDVEWVPLVLFAEQPPGLEAFPQPDEILQRQRRNVMDWNLGMKPLTVRYFRIEPGLESLAADQRLEGAL